MPRQSRLILALHFADRLEAADIAGVLDLALEVVEIELLRLRRAAQEMLRNDPLFIDEQAARVRKRFRVSDLEPAEREFTSHEVAEICGVAVRTACAWCDRGLLLTHRLPRTGPQAGPRRIKRSDLVDFMRRHAIPSQRPDLLAAE